MLLTKNTSLRTLSLKISSYLKTKFRIHLSLLPHLTMNNPFDTGFRLKFWQVESPYPINDFAHKGCIKIENRTGQDQEITGYVASYIATLNGQEILLGQDDSANRFGFQRISGGTFLFLTKKMGPCMEEINLSDFPVTVAAGQDEFLYYYIYELETLEMLKEYGITNAQTAKEQGCTFMIRMELKLAQPIEGETPVAERNIMVVEPQPEEA